MRQVHLSTAVCGAFITRRWEEPETFIRLTKEMGFPAHSFCADVLDPFFSGDRAYQLETATVVKEAAAKYGVDICDIYTGMATHRFHGLSHSNPVVRKRMVEWIEANMDIANAMGVSRIGGHWDAFSVEVLQDPVRTEEAWQRLVETFRALAVTAKNKGLSAIYQEQMYIPSEKPWTLAECERFVIETNRDNAGVPVRPTLDVGHMAGMHYGLDGADLDYRQWLRQFGAICEIVHIQQTTPDASHHWPFLPHYNERGHVCIPEIIGALRESFAEFSKSPLAKVIAPVDRIWLVLECIPGSTVTEERIISELTASAQYIAQFVPEEGVDFEI